jgi:hypothetical protein
MGSNNVYSLGVLAEMQNMISEKNIVLTSRVNLTFNDLKLGTNLVDGSYCITHKPYGTRKMMIINTYGIWLISDSTFNLIYTVPISELLPLSIYDVDIIYQSQDDISINKPIAITSRVTNIVVLDCFYNSGIDIRRYILSDRYKIFNNVYSYFDHMSDIKVYQISTRVIMNEHQFWNFNRLLLSSNPYYPSSGLLFLPNRPIRSDSSERGTGGQDNQLVWKYLTRQYLDLKAVWEVSNRYKEDAKLNFYDNDGNLIFASSGIKKVSNIDSLEVDGYTDRYGNLINRNPVIEFNGLTIKSGSIVEVELRNDFEIDQQSSLDYSIIHIHRIRNDKVRANNQVEVKFILESIFNPITDETMRGFSDILVMKSINSDGTRRMVSTMSEVDSFMESNPSKTESIVFMESDFILNLFKPFFGGYTLTEFKLCNIKFEYVTDFKFKVNKKDVSKLRLDDILLKYPSLNIDSQVSRISSVDPQYILSVDQVTLLSLYVNIK